jgi:hypothetical protein
MAVIEQEIQEKFAIYCGDCCEVLTTLPADRIHFSIYSPPFGGLYCYSSSDRDLSNASGYPEFFKHYEFVVRELARVTMPGRVTAVHAMDIPSGNTGNDWLTDFPGDIIRLHEKHDFRYVARYCVWKEPLAVRNRTLMKSLFHTTIVEDSSRCSAAHADYLLIFRKRGSNPIPIVHPYGLTEYIGEREVPRELLRFRGWKGSQLVNRYSHWVWRQYASAFWDDIRIWRTVELLDSKDQADEGHVHPLQLDVIERCLILWSNPGETVLTPFMGVGSEVCGALLNDRLGLGIELKPSYYRVAKRNIEYVLKHGKVPTKTGSLLPDEEEFEEENGAGSSEAEFEFTEPESKLKM